MADEHPLNDQIRRALRRERASTFDERRALDLLAQARERGEMRSLELTELCFLVPTAGRVLESQLSFAERRRLQSGDGLPYVAWADAAAERLREHLDHSTDL